MAIHRIVIMISSPGIKHASVIFSTSVNILFALYTKVSFSIRVQTFTENTVIFFVYLIKMLYFNLQ